jgi:hypothetical protein
MKLPMPIRILVFSALLFSMACKSKKEDATDKTPIKFDKEKWAIKKDRDYPYRDRMLHDLVYSKQLKGMKWDSVISRLGAPTRSDTNYLFYTIRQPYLANTIPLYTKSLVIEFNTDSTVRTTRIHE